MQQFVVVLECDWLRDLSNNDILTQYCHINLSTLYHPLTASLRASVMVDAKIHHNCTNTNVVMSQNVL